MVGGAGTNQKQVKGNQKWEKLEGKDELQVFPQDYESEQYNAACSVWCCVMHYNNIILFAVLGGSQIAYSWI